MITGRVDISRMLAQFKRLPNVTQKELKVLIDQQVKLFIDDRKTGVIGLTPPSNSGARGRKAKLQGETAIMRDLLGGRQASVSGARFAGVFLAVSDSLLSKAVELNTGNVRLWVTRSGEVYGTEKSLFQPNASVSQMRAHHKRYFKNGRMSQSRGRTRDVGRWKFIDKMVVSTTSFNRYLRFMKKRVGILASGWNSAAEKFKARVPAWIKRHSGNSQHRIKENKRNYVVTLSNQVGYDKAGTQRRVRSAIKYRNNAIKRRLPYLIRHAIKKSGI